MPDDLDPVLTVQALVEAGEALVAEQRLDEAGACFDRAWREFGEDPDPEVRVLALGALAYQAWIVSEAGLPEEAVALFDTVVSCVGESADPRLRETAANALYNKGHVLRDRGRLEEALATFAAAQRMADGDGPLPAGDAAASAVTRGAEAMVVSRAVLVDLERWDDAFRRCDEIVARYGSSVDPEIREHVAAALWHKIHIAADHDRGAVEQARAEFTARFGDAREPAIRAMYVRAMIRVGTWLEHERRGDQAREVYRDIVTRFPDPQRADVDELVTWTRERLVAFDRAIAKGTRQAVFAAGLGLAVLLSRRRR